MKMLAVRNLFPGFAKNRPTAHVGPAARRPEGPAARGPRPETTHDGPAARSRFSIFFCPCACTDLHRVLGVKSSVTIIILNNHFDPFIRCMLLREKYCHSLFIRPFTKPEREEVHSQWRKLFSNHSLRLKLSSEICELRIVTEFMIFLLSKYGLKITYIVR